MCVCNRTFETTTQIIVNSIRTVCVVYRVTGNMLSGSVDKTANIWQKDGVAGPSG